ncbi:MAG: serine/threonine-protein kinase, partial [Acidobacteriota bacterium]
VELYDSGAVNGIPYLAMQLVNGPTLSGLPPTIPLAEQVELMCQVAWGLQAAHELGIVHRDVKPSNILVERRIDGALHAYLADFGIARDPAGSRVTRTGDLIGTLSYLAPEHWSGPIRSPDPRSDIYALGLTFYEIFCGVPLRTSVTGDSKADGESRELALAFDAVARLPAALQTILQRCLAVDPDARYPTAGGLAEDLQRFLGRAGRSPSLPGRCGRRGGTRSGLGPAGRAAALLIGGFSLWLAARAKTSSVEDDSGDR